MQGRLQLPPSRQTTASAALTIPATPTILASGDLMCAHGLPGTAEVAVQSGLQAAHQIPVGRKQVSARRVSAEPADAGYAVRSFRNRDLGSTTCISCGHAGAYVGRLHSGRLAL
jgi:NADH dehydrogenase FAD-containing subunit